MLFVSGHFRVQPYIHLKQLQQFRCRAATARGTPVPEQSQVGLALRLCARGNQDLPIPMAFQQLWGASHVPVNQFRHGSETNKWGHLQLLCLLAQYPSSQGTVPKPFYCHSGLVSQRTSENKRKQTNKRKNTTHNKKHHTRFFPFTEEQRPTMRTAKWVVWLHLHLKTWPFSFVQPAVFQSFTA